MPKVLRAPPCVLPRGTNFIIVVKSASMRPKTRRKPCAPALLLHGQQLCLIRRACLSSCYLSRSARSFSTKHALRRHASTPTRPAGPTVDPLVGISSEVTEAALVAVERKGGLDTRVQAAYEVCTTERTTICCRRLAPVSVRMRMPPSTRSRRRSSSSTARGCAATFSAFAAAKSSFAGRLNSPMTSGSRSRPWSRCRQACAALSSRRCQPR